MTSTVSAAGLREVGRWPTSAVPGKGRRLAWGLGPSLIEGRRQDLEVRVRERDSEGMTREAEGGAAAVVDLARRDLAQSMSSNTPYSESLLY